jgi:mono/diheme cytochrome c family protein
MTTVHDDPARRRRWPLFVLGVILGGGAALLLVLLVGMPLAVGHRNNLPLEKIYGDAAVGLASRAQAGNATDPLAGTSRAITPGREAYTGSCAICHGATGDGKGAFGQALFPPATDLRGHDTQEKSDAQLFWIIKNGLSFAGMPAFGAQYNDQDVWTLVSYTRFLGQAGDKGLAIPTPTGAQLAAADPAGDPAARGAAVYFAQGCQSCHGAVGNAPGELGLRGNSREASQAIRAGRAGMPAYPTERLSDADLANLLAYLGTFTAAPRR